MKIYIASSWKNQHAVEMLTEKLKAEGHEVISFIEKALETHERDKLEFDVEDWLSSADALEKFDYDTTGATESDLVIYIGPSGVDAWAEVGAAWASGVKVIALYSKGEQVGLMRYMAVWAYSIGQVMDMVELFQQKINEGLTLLRKEMTK